MPPSVSRFVRRCREMEVHLRRVHGAEGTMWGRRSRDIVAMAARSPSAPFFSDRLYLMDTFGGGPLAPGAELLRGSLADRLLRRYRLGVRQLFGHGRLAGALLGPLERTERVDRALENARAMYAQAVVAGAALLRAHIERWDVSSPGVFGDQRVTVDGRSVSWHTLLALKRVVLLRERVGSVGTMVEIGSGTGEFARLMVATGTARSCVLVDIPPALAFAHELLEDGLGADRVDGFTPTRTQFEPRDGTCALLTPDQLECLARAQLVVNVASFGEMPKATVLGYLRQLKRLAPDVIVSVNVARPHPLNRAEGIGSEVYVAELAPEYTPRERAAWTRTVALDLPPAPEQYGGYEWILFRRAEVA